MRISDWSSDVCSSDLLPGLGEVLSSRLMHAALGGEAGGWLRLDARDVLVVHAGEMGVGVDWDESRRRLADWRAGRSRGNVVVTGFVARDAQGRATTLGRNGSDYSAAIFARSEEHTSELQSLMRISYAVFCLKKNNYHHMS